MAYFPADTAKARFRAFCAVSEGVKQFTLHARIGMGHTVRPHSRPTRHGLPILNESLPILNRGSCLPILNKSLPILNATRMYIHCITVIFMQGAAGGVSESRSMTGVTPMTTFFTKDPLYTTAVELSETRAIRTSESTANPLVL